MRLDVIFGVEADIDCSAPGANNASCALRYFLAHGQEAPD